MIWENYLKHYVGSAIRRTSTETTRTLTRPSLVDSSMGRRVETEVVKTDRKKTLLIIDCTANIEKDKREKIFKQVIEVLKNKRIKEVEIIYYHGEKSPGKLDRQTFPLENPIEYNNCNNHGGRADSYEGIYQYIFDNFNKERWNVIIFVSDGNTKADKDGYDKVVGDKPLTLNIRIIRDKLTIKKFIWVIADNKEFDPYLIGKHKVIHLDTKNDLT